MYKLRGFTLIEVMVTITIIGILSSIIYVSFSDARVNARNKAMTVELKEVQLAIETYRAQQGTYPSYGPGCGSGSTGRSNFDSGCDTAYIAGLTPEFIPRLPDPAESANPDCYIQYTTGANGNWYKLTAIRCLAGVSQQSGISPDQPLARCAENCGISGICDPTSPNYYESFAFYSLGGQCE